VIVNSLNHNPNGPATALNRLGYAMQEIGACCAPSADPAALPPFSTVDLANSSFSLAGMPGLAPGTADTNVEPISGDTVPAGSPAAASIGGTLVQDQHQNYVLVHRQAVGFDIATDGTITIGGHSYPVPSPSPASCGGCGGFHVLAVDRQTLTPLLDHSYMTNDVCSRGCDDWGDQPQMAADLHSLDRENVLFFIASVGTPEIPDAWASEWAAYHGWTVRLFDWLVHFGATPGALTDLVTHPRYALVGASSPSAPAPVFGSAEASTEVAQAAHPGEDVTATGELQGVLGIGHSNMWYQPVMSNAPLVKVINGQPQDPSRANFGLSLLLANTTAPWPYTAAGDPDQAAYQAAYAYISNQLCARCGGDIRDYYDTQAAITAWQRDLPAISYPSPPPTAYTEQQFEQMKTEITQEVDDVLTVDGNKSDMHTILEGSAIAKTGALAEAYTTVRDTIPVSNAAQVLSIIGSVFLDLLNVLPEVGPVVASIITLGEDGADAVEAFTGGNDPAADLQVRADQLAAQAMTAFEAEETTLDSDFDRIYSDYGKLSTLASDIKNDPADWDLSHKDGISRAETAMTTAAEIAYYQSLLPAVYDILHGRDMKITAPLGEPPLPPSQPSPLEYWCASFVQSDSYECYGHFEYGTSAYAFPNDQLNPGDPGWDVIVLQKPPADATFLAGDPFPAGAMNAINNLGVDPADVFLRWPLDRIYCKVGNTRACQIRPI
jgi:hypothetical protein